MDDEELQDGRPEFQPTATQRLWVSQAANVGLSQEIIRLNVINPDSDLPVSLKTLRKHFRQELDSGLALWGMDILTTATSVARDKNHDQYARMAIFLMQTRLGMKPATITELSGLDGEALAFPQLVVIKDGNKESPAEE